MTALNIQVSHADIQLVVAAFYDRVRKEPILGPIFSLNIKTEEDWKEHEQKIAAFWANAILREGGYDGTPMATHSARPDVMSEHFTIWLNLFEDVLADELKVDAAQRWNALARRIGRGLSMGIWLKQSQAGAPNLRGDACPCGS